MPAFVRNAFVFRYVWQIQCFVDSHRVHVGAEQYGFSTAPEVEFSQQVVSFREGENLCRLKAFQFVSDEGGSFYFLVGSLCHAMQLVAYLFAIHNVIIINLKVQMYNFLAFDFFA